MIGLSPKGVLEATTIFPIMFLIALILDLLTILLTLTVLGGIILGVIGFLTVGLWIIIRSGGERNPSQESKKEKEGAQGETKMAAREGEEAAAREGTQSAAKTGTKVATKGGTGAAGKTAGKSMLRVGLRIGAVTGLKFIPVVNAFSSIFFGWTVMVIGEFISDLRSFSLEEAQ